MSEWNAVVLVETYLAMLLMWTFWFATLTRWHPAATRRKPIGRLKTWIAAWILEDDRDGVLMIREVSFPRVVCAFSICYLSAAAVYFGTLAVNLGHLAPFVLLAGFLITPFVTLFNTYARPCGTTDDAHLHRRRVFTFRFYPVAWSCIMGAASVVALAGVASPGSLAQEAHTVLTGSPGKQVLVAAILLVFGAGLAPPSVAVPAMRGMMRPPLEWCILVCLLSSVGAAHSAAVILFA